MALLLVSLVSTFSPGIAQGADLPAPVQSALKLKITAGKPVVDGVFLNGQGPYRFLLDTGSQSNQVESGLARKLGLAATLQLELDTPSGPSQVPGGRVAKVTLGSAEAANQEFLFTRFDGFNNSAPDIRGVLGQEFLAHFDYTLDYQHRQLIFSGAEGQPPVGDHVPTRLDYGRMAIPTSQGELVLDSGAEMLFLFRASSHPVTALVSTASVSTASGMRAGVSIEQAPELRISGHAYHADRAEFRAVPDAPEAGLLPTSLFRAIYISNSAHYVIFNPEIR